MRTLTVVGSKVAGDLRDDGLYVAGSKLSGEQRALLQTSLRIPGLPPPASPADAPDAPTAPDDEDKIIESVASQLDPADLAAIRADPEAKSRFVKRLLNQRELNAEKLREREAANAKAAAEAKTAERNRLAHLGASVARAEVGK